MNKCQGCGILLQTVDPKKIGYAISENDKLCQRCFRIKNYNDYKLVTQENKSFIDVLKKINQTKDLVLLVVDVFTLNDLSIFYKYLNNDILLVITKRDILPKSLNDDKILNYFNYRCIDKILISSYKNYNFDYLFDLIKRYKKTDNIYIVGYTNAGKSTLINKLIYNYSNIKPIVTTSILPSTTLDTIKIKLNDLTLIDTPGLISKGNIINYLEPSMIKKIIPNKEIKPITYQVKEEQLFNVENLFKLKCSKVNLTFYLANQLEIKRQYKIIDLKEKYQQINIKANQDLVIEGLGFIKFTNDCIVNINCLKGVNVYTRKSLI